MNVTLDLDTAEGYETFLAIKALPVYSFTGRRAWFPDAYADRVGLARPAPAPSSYSARPGLFDYQRDIAALAVRKRKFAVFADCGLGKTLDPPGVRPARPRRPAGGPGGPDRLAAHGHRQTLAEAARFYGDRPADRAGGGPPTCPVARRAGGPAASGSRTTRRSTGGASGRRPAGRPDPRRVVAAEVPLREVGAAAHRARPRPRLEALPDRHAGAQRPDRVRQPRRLPRPVPDGQQRSSPGSSSTAARRRTAGS
jgi:hypothetical protein